MLTDAQRAPPMITTASSSSPDVFLAEDIGELRRVTDELVTATAAVTANDSVYDLEDTHSTDEPRVRRLKAPHAIHPVYMRASRHPKVVQLLTDLWGQRAFRHP
jgi:phytanoyl-CoA hydroxylase